MEQKLLLNYQKEELQEVDQKEKEKENVLIAERKDIGLWTALMSMEGINVLIVGEVVI